MLTVTYTPPDTTIPAITITGPTTSSTYATVSSALTVSGTASDNVGVTQVSWSNDRGGSGTASSTASYWSAAGIALQSGTNIITVSARDTAANQKTDTITVTYTPPDTTAPTVTIMGPTSAATSRTTSSVLTIGGTSSDDRGVTAVSWSNNRGGYTDSPAAPPVGVLRLSVCRAARTSSPSLHRMLRTNRGPDVLTVTYTPPSDTTVPVVGSSQPDDLGFLRNDVRVGRARRDVIRQRGRHPADVVQRPWRSGRQTEPRAGASRPSHCQSGTNNVTVVAQDAAGNRATALLTITYSAPVSLQAFTLSASTYQSWKWVRVLLGWSAVQGRAVDVYRNSIPITKTTNDGSFTDAPRAPGTLTYQLCVSGTNICSNTVEFTSGN